MLQNRIAILLAATTAATVRPALADTWCNANILAFPDIFFCDDFDRYCQSPPPAPAQCPYGSSKSDAALRAVWNRSSTNPNGECGTEFTIETPVFANNKWSNASAESEPFGGRYPCQGDAQLGQQTVELVPTIQTRFGGQYTALMGTDANPLVLRFEMNGGNCNTLENCNFHMHYDVGYMELALDNAIAPMDYIRVGATETTGCMSCYPMCPSPHHSVHVPWPTVCQSYEPRTASPHCPPLMTGVRAALAVGANALLDNNPCHCETPSSQIPQNPRLSFYDGLKWRILGRNHAPFTGNYIQDAAYTGDFVLGQKYNRVTLTIKTSTVDIELTTKTPATDDPDTPVVSSKVTDVPRLHLGGFNKLRGGAAHGCELNNGSYSCAGNVRCTRIGEFRCDQTTVFVPGGSAHIVFDGVYLRGGQGLAQTGACCLPDAICQHVTQTDCQTLGGSYNGVNSSCLIAVCCHHPFADADGDQDVDMTDYGRFQACFTGPVETMQPECACFDRNHTQTIDTADFDAFLDCVSGPALPWSQSGTTGCVP